MATLRTRKYYRKRLLESIGNQSAEEIGKLALEMMGDIESIYDEVQAKEGDLDTFEYERGEDYKKMYEDLENEYKSRFGNGEDLSEPLAQPAADDIAIEVNPDTGITETVLGNGVEAAVSNTEDIFEYMD